MIKEEKSPRAIKEEKSPRAIKEEKSPRAIKEEKSPRKSQEKTPRKSQEKSPRKSQEKAYLTKEDYSFSKKSPRKTESGTRDPIEPKSSLFGEATAYPSSSGDLKVELLDTGVDQEAEQLRQNFAESMNLSPREDNGYAAEGDIMGCIAVIGEVYVHIKKSKPGYSFYGLAGGLVGLPLCPPANLIGKVYTDDLVTLCNSTRRFQLTTTPVWVSVVFLDKNSKVLGNFQAATIGFLAGVSGGKGKWKQRTPRIHELRRERHQEHLKINPGIPSDQCQLCYDEDLNDTVGFTV